MRKDKSKDHRNKAGTRIRIRIGTEDGCRNSSWKRHGTSILLAMLLLVGVVAADLLIPRLTQRVIDQGIAQQDMAAISTTSLLMLAAAAASAIFAIDANAVATGNGLASEWARGNVTFMEMVSNWNLAQWTDPNIRWGEISFNEWEVPLWPMKWVMVLGGLLLVLQGISKIGKDIQAIARGA